LVATVASGISVACQPEDNEHAPTPAPDVVLVKQ